MKGLMVYSALYIGIKITHFVSCNSDGLGRDCIVSVRSAPVRVVALPLPGSALSGTVHVVALSSSGSTLSGSVHPVGISLLSVPTDVNKVHAAMRTLDTES
jgi:hypothetical protein